MNELLFSVGNCRFLSFYCFERRCFKLKLFENRHICDIFIYMELTADENLRIGEIQKNYEELCEEMSYEEVFLDKKLFLSYEKRKNKLQPIVENISEYCKLKREKQEVGEFLTCLKGEERRQFLKEYDITCKQLDEVVVALKKMLNQSVDEENIVLEICANNQEDSDLLVGVYENYCHNFSYGFKCEMLSGQTFIRIKGYGVKSIFINEVGCHSFLRGGAVSVAKVFVYEEVVKNEQFNDDDFVVEICRSSGAGGQHVNTTDSAVKVIHKKTGLSVICQDERSQFQNKEKAFCSIKKKVADYYFVKNKKMIEDKKCEQLKLMNVFVRKYDLDNNIVIKKDKTVIEFNSFLSGKVL